MQQSVNQTTYQNIETEYCLDVNNEVETGAAVMELFKLSEKLQQSKEEKSDEEEKEEEEKEEAK